MKKYLVLALLLIASYAAADFPGSPISGGGGSGTATAITDNLIVNADVNSSAGIVGSKLADNTITSAKILDNTIARSKVSSDWVDQDLTTTDNVTFNTVTAASFATSAADNTHKSNFSNSGPATNLTTAGDMAFDRAAGQLVVNDTGVTTDNVVLASVYKSYSFGIDNVIASEHTNLFVWPRIPNKIIVDSVYGYASTDNVVGRLYSCASDNVSSCVALDSADWTITNAVTGFSDTSLSAGSVAANRWLKWVTTSVGTSNSNDLFVTIRYREDY